MNYLHNPNHPAHEALQVGIAHGKDALTPVQVTLLMDLLKKLRRQQDRATQEDVEGIAYECQRIENVLNP